MVFAFSFGLGAAAFVLLIALMLLNRFPRSLGLGVLLACAATFVWAVFAALQPWWLPGAAHALETVRTTAWLIVIAFALVAVRGERVAGIGTLWLPLGVGAFGILILANDWRFVSLVHSPTAFSASQVLARVLLSVSGIFLVENLYRNVSPGRRWNVVPFCIALGTLFAYDLFVFCEAVVLKTVSPALLAGRGLILVLIVPLLVLTMARNPDWDIDIHVSRRAVFHGATLTAAGLFLLVAAGVAGLIGRLHGQWAALSEVVFFCGSVVLVVVALSTESIRSRVRRLISENFFSTRYDYRGEWLRTIATLSSAGAQEPLPTRAIRALADVVDSPGGALWLENAAGDYAISQILNITIDAESVEARAGSFLAGFCGGEKIQEFRDQAAPSWAKPGTIWLAVPLMKIDRLIGFVVLAPPRAPAVLNWESFDVLLSIGQQVAAYLEEERATRALLESQALVDYSRRFSFVIHDIKNVSGQLALLMTNVDRFGDRAEFRADMVRSLRGASDKLQRLVERLKSNTPAAKENDADPAQVISEVVRELNGAAARLHVSAARHTERAKIAPADLNAILTHLVTNALEASSEDDEVSIALRNDSGQVVIEVTDKGPGMSADFVRNQLFVPLRSTKRGGHGIGAYQARHLTREAGGELEVITAVGRGTVMRVVLPEVHRAPAILPDELAS